MKKLSLTVLICTGLLLTSQLTGCATTRRSSQPVKLNTKQEVKNLRGHSVVRTGRATTNIRRSALEEIALSVSAQAALARRAKEIDASLDDNERVLDKVFNFNALMLKHHILPPVLDEGHSLLNLADPHTIRIADRTFKIIKQARFVTTPPNWRDYIWQEYTEPEAPNPSLLPRNKVEREIWEHAVEEGWAQGMRQANTIFNDNLARLKRDFDGMILYRKLLAMNMVSPPFVSHTNLGVTGDGNQIHIDDNVLHISALPQLRVNSKQWRALLTHDHLFSLGDPRFHITHPGAGYGMHGKFAAREQLPPNIAWLHQPPVQHSHVTNHPHAELDDHSYPRVNQQ